MYARLINDVLEYAPDTFRDECGGTIIEFNKSVECMVANGFKFVEDIKPIYNSETHSLVLNQSNPYTESEEKITINYLIIEKPDPNFNTKEKFKEIELSQKDQDDAIVRGMIATAELCEMVLPILEAMPQFISIENRNVLREGVSAMVDVYANLCLLGYYTTDPKEVKPTVRLVHEYYREKVQARLNEWA